MGLLTPKHKNGPTFQNDAKKKNSSNIRDTTQCRKKNLSNNSQNRTVSYMNLYGRFININFFVCVSVSVCFIDLGICI